MKKIRDFIQSDCAFVCNYYYNHLKDLKNHTILITGGTGFVGKWLIELILYLNITYNFNIKLYVLSRNSTIQAKQYPHFQRKDVVFIDQDVRNPLELVDDIHYIIHCAAKPVTQFSDVDPIGLFHTIVKGTSNILDASLRLSNLIKILNISSGQVYGSTIEDNQLIREDSKCLSMDCNSIHSIYAESKRMSESICAVYRSQYRLPVLTARPFSFVGPYQPLNGTLAVSNFIRDSLKGGPIKIFSDGESIRSYMYPSDMALWILGVLANGNIGSTYNIGSPICITLHDLASKIARLFSKSIQVQTKQMTDISFTKSMVVPSVDKAVHELKVEMKVDLDSALRKTIDWYKMQIEKELL